MKTPNILTTMTTQENIDRLPIMLNTIRDDLGFRDVEVARLCKVTPHTLGTWRRGIATPKDFARVYFISCGLMESSRNLVD